MLVYAACAFLSICVHLVLQRKADEVGARLHTLSEVLQPHEMTHRRAPHGKGPSRDPGHLQIDVEALNRDLAVAALRLLSGMQVSNLSAGASAVGDSKLLPGDTTTRNLPPQSAPSDQRAPLTALAAAIPQELDRSPELLAALEARPPCRFEVLRREVMPAREPLTLQYGQMTGQGQSPCRVDVVLDIAHNPDAVSTLSDTVRRRYPNIPVR